MNFTIIYKFFENNELLKINTFKMYQLLKVLNSNKSLNERELEGLINSLTLSELDKNDYDRSSDNLKYLFEYKHTKTHDNILIYAARFKNLNLIKFLFDKHKIEFNYTNKDGKNALHEVNKNFSVLNYLLILKSYSSVLGMSIE